MIKQELTPQCGMSNNIFFLVLGIVNIFGTPNKICPIKSYGTDSIKSYSANIVSLPLKRWTKTLSIALDFINPEYLLYTVSVDIYAQ